LKRGKKKKTACVQWQLHEKERVCLLKKVSGEEEKKKPIVIEEEKQEPHCKNVANPWRAGKSNFYRGGPQKEEAAIHNVRRGRCLAGTKCAPNHRIGEKKMMLSPQRKKDKGETRPSEKVKGQFLPHRKGKKRERSCSKEGEKLRRMPEGGGGA